MHTITAAAPGLTTDEIWAVSSALRFLDEAIEQVGEACAEARQLVDDAHWESAGVRALRHTLSVLSTRLAGEYDELLFRREQLRAVTS